MGDGVESLTEHGPSPCETRAAAAGGDGSAPQRRPRTQIGSVATSAATRAAIVAVFDAAGTRWLTVDELLAQMTVYRSRPGVRPYLRGMVADGTLRVRRRWDAAYAPREYARGEG